MLSTRFLAAFGVPGFRWLWANSHLYSTSLIMGRLALGWLVLNQTGSAGWVGVAAGLEGLGKVGFGVLTGVIVDRSDKRVVMLATQLFSGLAALAFGALLVSGQAALWHMLLMALAQGAVESLNSSAGNTLLYEIVGRRHVVNASAATLLSFNLARITGSALAGILIDRGGAGWCYLALGLLACVAVLPGLLLRGRFRTAYTKEPFLTALLGGLRYAWRHQPVRHLLTLSIVVEAFGFAHYTMVPVIAQEVLRVGPVELGWLSSAAGVGALVGILAIASLGDFKAKGRLLLGVTAAAGVALFAFAFSPWYGLSLALSVLIGVGLFAYDVLMHALFQLLTSDAVRGRVFSIYVLTFGFNPLGGLLAGQLAVWAGAPFAVALGGGIIVLYVLGALRSVRQIAPTAEEAAAPAGD